MVLSVIVNDPYLVGKSKPEVDEEIVNADGLTLSYKEWRERGDYYDKPRAGILIAHGYGERIEKYVHLAERLTASGYRVSGADFRGMGRSGGTRYSIKSFDQYSMDLQTSLCRLKRDLRKDAPVFIYGHSMGALAGLHFLAGDLGSPVSGVILSAPLFEFGDKIPFWQIIAGRAATVFLPEFKIKTASNSNRLTRCMIENEKMANDELRASYITLEWFFAAQRASRSVQMAFSANSAPTLWLLPGEDKVVSASATEALFTKFAEAKEDEMTRFEGMLHELHVELKEDRERVFERVVNWLNARCNRISV